MNHSSPASINNTPDNTPDWIPSVDEFLFHQSLNQPKTLKPLYSNEDYIHWLFQQEIFLHSRVKPYLETLIESLTQNDHCKKHMARIDAPLFHIYRQQKEQALSLIHLYDFRSSNSLANSKEDSNSIECDLTSHTQEEDFPFILLFLSSISKGIDIKINLPSKGYVEIITQVQNEENVNISFYTTPVEHSQEHPLRLGIYNQLGKKSTLTIAGNTSQKAKSHIEIMTRVHHSEESSFSRQKIHNLTQHSQAKVWVHGTIHVGPNGKDTDGDFSHRGLILDPGGHIIARPNLIIHNSDVATTHGSATGSLNPQELFYLQSKGLSSQEATSLLTQAFLKSAYEIEKPNLHSIH